MPVLASSPVGAIGLPTLPDLPGFDLDVDWGKPSIDFIDDSSSLSVYSGAEPIDDSGYFLTVSGYGAEISIGDNTEFRHWPDRTYTMTSGSTALQYQYTLSTSPAGQGRFVVSSDHNDVVYVMLPEGISMSNRPESIHLTLSADLLLAEKIASFGSEQFFARATDLTVGLLFRSVDGSSYFSVPAQSFVLTDGSADNVAIDVDVSVPDTIPSSSLFFGYSLIFSFSDSDFVTTGTDYNIGTMLYSVHIVNWVSSYSFDSGGEVPGLIGSIIQIISDFFSTILDFLTNIVTWLVSLFIPTPDNIGPWLDDLSDRLWSSGDPISQVISFLTSASSRLFNAILDAPSSTSFEIPAIYMSHSSFVPSTTVPSGDYSVLIPSTSIDFSSLSGITNITYPVMSFLIGGTVLISIIGHFITIFNMILDNLVSLKTSPYELLLYYLFGPVNNVLRTIHTSSRSEIVDGERHTYTTYYDD